ncbi:MAG: ADP-ribosylation factor-like protein [Promethearchaeota archaeon]
MSEDKQEIEGVIETFAKFLDPTILEKLIYSKKGKNKKITQIEQLLDLPIYTFKFLNEQEAKILEEVLDIADIGELSKLDPKDPFANLMRLESTADPVEATEMRVKLKSQIEMLKEKFPKLEFNLKKAITISSLIRSVKKDKTEIEKKEEKVVVVGLDNAGKSAIISKFGGKMGISDILKLKPTKGIERQKLESNNLAKRLGNKKRVDLIIWDMGGQEQYRKKYLETPEKYFFQSDLVIYVIDIQDPDRFDESFGYFISILKILVALEEFPYMLIFLHKFDPDLEEDPQILLNIELLKERLKEMFDVLGNPFDYEIYLTSIYSLISNEPEFSKFIKEIMKENVALNDPTFRKVEGLGKILEETMNAIIRLSESLSSQLMNIDERLRAIESGAVQVAQSGGIVAAKTPMIQQSEHNVRTNVLNELRDLFAKKRKLDLNHTL